MKIELLLILAIDFEKKFLVAKTVKKKVKSKFELEIVDLVRQKRRENKLTQENIAEILNVTPGYIGQVESRNEPSMYTHDQLNVLAMEMECSPREFYPGRVVKSKF